MTLRNNTHTYANAFASVKLTTRMWFSVVCTLIYNDVIKV